MANVAEMREQLANLLSQQISLDDFEAWFAPYTWNIHKDGDAEVQKLAYAIEHSLSRFDEDCDGLRIELEGILGPSRGENRTESPVLVADCDTAQSNRSGPSR